MTSFFVSTRKSANSGLATDDAKARWQDFKQARNPITLQSAFAAATVIAQHPREPSFYDNGDGSWVVCAGTWLHKGMSDLVTPRALLARFFAVGAHALARELEGVFSIVIGDVRNESVVVITDPMGSLHTYLRQSAHGVWVSTASIALSDSKGLDPLGLAEYLATGIIYEDRSLWLGVRKLEPASVTVIEGSKVSTSYYWRIAHAFESRLSLQDASEGLMTNLVSAIAQLGSLFKPGVSDLTGGYDSRLLLCGILASDIDFDYTVAGPSDSADVVTASAIAAQLGLRLNHVENSPAFSLARFDQAISLSDGEYNAFDFARILESQGTMAQKYDMSLNGSFGEVARGYWWELLWPHMDKTRPLDAAMLARKRFGAVPFVDLLKHPPFESLVGHLGGVVQRTVEPFQDFALCSQMDAVYLSMRMQRWQGRIASNTNQIWPALSPLGFTHVLSPILAAVPSARFRSLMPRYIFSKWNPALASIPLEHGYPPAVATLGNVHKFAPILGSYYDKVVQKLATRMGRAKHAVAANVPSLAERFGDLLNAPGCSLLKAPELLASGLFEEERLLHFLNQSTPISGPTLEQWQRLVSLEYTLQKFHTCQ